jgi:hypothetical protein
MSVLTEGDLISPCWLRLKAHMEKRIDLLRRQNDGHHDEIKTAALRGAIQEIKNLLALETPAPMLDPDGE